MSVFKVSLSKFKGTSTAELKKKALNKLLSLSRTETPYIESAYFKERVYLGTYWAIASQKEHNEQARRFQFFACALELLQNCNYEPIIHNTYLGKMYRFEGETSNGERFIVQIKDGMLNRKEFVSTYPPKQK